MRPDAALEYGIAVDHQMVRGDRRRQPPRPAAHEIHRLFGGDMFENDGQLGELTEQRFQNPLDEHRFPIEDIDARIGHLAMHQKRHAGLLHDLEDARDARHVGHAGRRIGRRPGGIELGRGEDAVRVTGRQIPPIGALGEITGHQRLEVAPLIAERLEDALTVGFGHPPIGDRGVQIGHDDRPPETPGGEGRDGIEHGAVAQMDMPVVGPAEAERGGSGGLGDHPRLIA